MTLPLEKVFASGDNLLASIRLLFAGSGSATFSLSDSRIFSFSSPSSGTFCSSGPRVFSSYYSSCGNSSLSGTRKFSFFNPSSHFLLCHALFCFLFSLFECALERYFPSLTRNTHSPFLRNSCRSFESMFSFTGKDFRFGR